MDEVQRMYRQLVRTIRANFPQYLSQPFEVGELYSTILPYRLHRRELGLETNQDYELALMEMLSGARGYLIVEDRMRDVLSAEHVAATPDTARIRDFASAHVALAPEALQHLDGQGRTPDASQVAPAASHAASVQAGAIAGVGASGRKSTTVGEAGRRVTRPITVRDTGENCPFCNGVLPPGRQICFCPHCGQDLTVVHCPACGGELERHWKYCVTCGRAADSVR